MSSLLFLLSCWEVTRVTEKLDLSKELGASFKLSSTAEKLLCSKWRSERNFWISLFSLVLWLVLYRLHAYIKELEGVKSALRECQKTN